MPPVPARMRSPPRWSLPADLPCGTARAPEPRARCSTTRSWPGPNADRRLASAVRSLEIRRGGPPHHAPAAAPLVPPVGVDDLSRRALGVLFGEEEDERDDVL